MLSRTSRAALAVVLATATATGSSGAASASGGTLDEQLLYLIEEEKLAGDVYELAEGRYQGRVFGNIAVSEDVHVDAVRGLLESRGLEDPTLGKAAGAFVNDDLQALYDQLEARFLTNRTEAVQVGIDIEVKDLVDLQELLDMAPPADVERVVEHLLAGSENHLAAFLSQQ